MYTCEHCGHTFADQSGHWNEVDDRDELIEDTILKCPRCQSSDVNIMDKWEEEDLLEEYSHMEEAYHDLDDDTGLDWP
jgi:DNA-directed RNA polymerase subunit RPC12/RpoP